MLDPSSRNPFMSADQTTLADVLAKITDDTALTPQRRSNLRASLRALGKLMGRNLAYLPASPGYYRKTFKGLHPEHCGLTRSRIRNIKSDVMFALKRTGCIDQGHTYMAPLTREWQALWELAMVAGRKRVYVSRFMHFCSAQGIEPEDVDDAVAERLKVALIEESFVENPVRTHKGILRMWNTLVDCVPGWPQTRLTIANDRDDYSIPLERFPQSLQDEVEALVDFWSGKDILDDSGPAKPLTPRTIKGRLYRLRQVASALVLCGRPIEEVTSIAGLVELQAAKTTLQFYLDRAGGERTSQIHGLAILLKTLAKHWVKVDEAHLDALKAYCAKVDPNIKGLTAKNRDRLRQFDDARNIHLLLDFPARRVEEVLQNDQGRLRDAVAVQTALAVEILLMAPMRATNLAGLHIERHIQRSRTGKDGVVHLVIPGTEVKNGQDLEFPLPPETVRLLDLYLRDFHPRLSDAPSPWLFPGRDASEHKAVMTLGQQITIHVFKSTGLQVNLHLFRHVAAKLYLDRNPGGYEVVRRHLGHRSMDTTTRFYAGMETAAASRHFDEEILKLRRASRQTAAAGG